MKKTFTLLAAVLISASMYAYSGLSTMSITSNVRGNIRVIVDGEQYRDADNSITINNLQPGYHSVKVYQVLRGRKPGRGWGNNGWDNDNYRTLYSANVFVKPRYDVDITINRFGKVFFDEQPVYYGDDDDRDNDHHDNDDHWNNSNDYNYNRVMNAGDFNRFKESLRNEAFESTRLNIAKQVIASNWFNTAQVKEVVKLFMFENNKLELAKYAYRYTVDKSNYYSVADCFSFSNNKDELMRYIQNYR